MPVPPTAASAADPPSRHQAGLPLPTRLRGFMYAYSCGFAVSEDVVREVLMSLAKDALGVAPGGPAPPWLASDHAPVGVLLSAAVESGGLSLEDDARFCPPSLADANPGTLVLGDLGPEAMLHCHRRAVESRVGVPHAVMAALQAVVVAALYMGWKE